MTTKPAGMRELDCLNTLCNQPHTWIDHDPVTGEYETVWCPGFTIIQGKP